MNKIIRFASVIAIVCASLVYAGCTKDFSSDIARLEEEKATKADVQAVNSALEAFKTEANAQLADLAAKKADKTTVEALQTKVNGIETIAKGNQTEINTLKGKVSTAEGLIGTLQSDLAAEITNRQNADTAIQGALARAKAALEQKDIDLANKDAQLDKDIKALNKYADSTFTAIKADYAALDAAQKVLIDTLDAQRVRLEARVAKVEEAVAVLQGQMEDVIAMVQSITFIPGSYNHDVFGYTGKMGAHDHEWDPQFTWKDTTYTYEWDHSAVDWWKAFTNPGQWKKIVKAVTDTFYLPGIVYHWSWTDATDGTHQHAIAGTTVADAVAYDFKIADNQFISNPVFSGTIMVTPASAAKRITKENLKLRVVATNAATKAWASAADDDAITVTFVEEGKTPGYVNFVGCIKNPDKTTRLSAGYDVVAIIDNTLDHKVVENVVSAPFNVVTAATVTGYSAVNDSIVKPDTIAIQPIQYMFFDKVAKALVDTTYVPTVIVTPDSVANQCIFDPARFEVYAKVCFEDFLWTSLPEMESLLGAEAGTIKPLAGDTTVVINYRYPTEADAVLGLIAGTSGINTKVGPVNGNTLVSVVQKSVRGLAKPVLIANVGLKNTQLFTEAAQVAAYNASRIYGSYVVTPSVDDKTAKFITDGDVCDVAWNWDLATKPFAAGKDIASIAVNDVDSLIRIVGDNYSELTSLSDTNSVVKIYNQKSGKVYNAAGSQIVKVNSNTVKATIKSSDIEYGVADSTYVFEIYRFDNERAKIYTASFTFSVAAKPVDTAFDFGCDTLVLDDLSKDVIADNNFSEKLFKYISDNNDVAIANDKLSQVIAKAAIQPVTSVSYIATDSAVFKADTLAYEKVIAIEKTLTTAYGFDVKVKQAIVINKPALTLVSVPEYVSGSNGNYSVQVKSYVNAQNAYALETMPFEQYLTIAGNTGKKYDVHANLNAIYSATNTGAVVIPTNPAIVDADKDGSKFAEDIIRWNTLDTTAFKLGVALKTKNNEATIDTATINFWTKDPVTFSAQPIDTVEAFHADTKVDLCQAISLVDFNGVELVDAEDNRLHHIYGQYVDYGQKNLTFTITKANENLKDYAKIVGNQLVLEWNQAMLNEPVSFTVKASVDYIFGNKTAEFVVTVKPIAE